MATGDVQIGRDRWRNRFFFIISTLGAMIGYGNIWKFPQLAFKHGTLNFIFMYIIALLFFGIPMLILELTMGQKMQRGSVGSLRGITPRLAGAGWAAGFSGFITSVIYNIILGLCLYYLFNTGSMPWKEGTERALSCQTATTNAVSGAQLYLYMNVTKANAIEDCEVYKLGDDNRFAGSLFGFVALTWFIVFLMLSRGVKSIQYSNLVTAIVPFILLIVLIIIFAGINSDQGGDGIKYYFNQAAF